MLEAGNGGIGRPSMKNITLRVDQETADRCERLRIAGANRAYKNSSFARVIFNIGLDRYEKTLLPIETGDEYQAARTGAQIIPFPSLDA